MGTATSVASCSSVGTSTTMDTYTTGGDRLIDYMDKRIKEMEREMECPMCFETACAPILKCPEEHMICAPCRGKVDKCPECLTSYPPGSSRFRSAERTADKLATLRSDRKKEVLKWLL